MLLWNLISYIRGNVPLQHRVSKVLHHCQLSYRIFNHRVQSFRQVSASQCVYVFIGVGNRDDKDGELLITGGDEVADGLKNLEERSTDFGEAFPHRKIETKSAIFAILLALGLKHYL
ncbi:unnamed protein product [Lactuca saligna]|uniref:Uncharacterized protein n=1 Tax=Lactuca saligna TaxID=75948 RepID=A0AA35YUW1_LACSI|nr:unnamed protein product [Lactuca saligna]